MRREDLKALNYMSREVPKYYSRQRDIGCETCLSLMLETRRTLLMSLL